jgi:hypothetical protein
MRRCLERVADCSQRLSSSHLTAGASRFLISWGSSRSGVALIWLLPQQRLRYQARGVRPAYRQVARAAVGLESLGRRQLAFVGPPQPVQFYNFPVLAHLASLPAALQVKRVPLVLSHHRRDAAPTFRSAQSRRRGGRAAAGAAAQARQVSLISVGRRRASPQRDRWRGR